MLTYTVKYKQPGQWFWRTVKKVKGDNSLTNYRQLFLESGEVLQFPYFTTFKFGKERELVIIKNMEKEAGQPVSKQ